MSKIETIKSYTGQDLENIFFRPMLTGPSAEEMGIKVMYNMPVPTVLHFWKRSGDVLQKFDKAGWSGSAAAQKFQKTMELKRVKAEVGYSAEDYFSMVYELITASPNVNMEDLSGTELEAAETALFKQDIAEGIRSIMWLGNTERYSFCNTFDGFLKHLTADLVAGERAIRTFGYSRSGDKWASSLLAKMWSSSTDQLKNLKSEGNLAFFVSSDVYAQYENELDGADYEAAYIARQDGRQQLHYRGIPVIDVQLASYYDYYEDLPTTFALLTDRRNLALAVNTSDFPGTEVKMWYNPDQMENRQRAVFMAGCDYLMPELVTFAICTSLDVDVQLEDNTAIINFEPDDIYSIRKVNIQLYSGGKPYGEKINIDGIDVSGEYTYECDDLTEVSVIVYYHNGTVTDTRYRN